MSNLTTLKTLLSLANFEAVWADLSADERATIKADFQAALRAAGKNEDHGRLSIDDIEELEFAEQDPIAYKAHKDHQADVKEILDEYWGNFIVLGKLHLAFDD